MKSKKIRAAVIGAGNMGRNHVRTYATMDGYDLVALADIDPKSKALAKEFDCKYYQDFQEMLDTEDIEVVSIVVPTPLHYDVAKEVMRRKIHCLVEKPIASTTLLADKMIQQAEKEGIIFTVGHIERFNPIIRKIKELLDKNTIGEISSIVCKRVGGFPIREPKTDVIIDLAVHDIDIMSFLLGRQPDKIYSHGSRTHHSKKIDSAEILLDYGEASGFVQANWIMPVKIRTIAVTGSKGYIEGNYITQELKYYEHNIARIENGFDSFVQALGEPKEHSIEVAVEEPLRVELQAMMHAIQGKKNELMDPKDAREALRIALKSVEAYE